MQGDVKVKTQKVEPSISEFKEAWSEHIGYLVLLGNNLSFEDFDRLQKIKQELIDLVEKATVNYTERCLNKVVT
jgi:hypothetical protein